MAGWDVAGCDVVGWTVVGWAAAGGAALHWALALGPRPNRFSKLSNDTVVGCGQYCSGPSGPPPSGGVP